MKEKRRTHYYVIKDGRKISDFQDRESAERMARDIEGEIAFDYDADCE